MSSIKSVPQIPHTTFSEHMIYYFNKIQKIMSSIKNVPQILHTTFSEHFIYYYQKIPKIKNSHLKLFLITLFSHLKRSHGFWAPS